MNKKEAIKKLKYYKELLEIEAISKEEYSKYVKLYKPHILANEDDYEDNNKETSRESSKVKDPKTVIQKEINPKEQTPILQKEINPKEQTPILEREVDTKNNNKETSSESSKVKDPKTVIQKEINPTNQSSKTEKKSLKKQKKDIKSPKSKKSIYVLMGLFITIIVLLLFSDSDSTSILYEERFTGLNGKGITSTETNLTRCNWSVDVSGASLTNGFKHLKVVNERLEARYLDGPAYWLSPSISITDYNNVSIALAATEIGAIEVDDVIETEYRIDGGEWITFSTNGSLSDDFTSAAVYQDGLSGNVLEIRVKMENNSSQEYFRIDDIIVTGDISDSLHTGEDSSNPKNKVTNQIISQPLIKKKKFISENDKYFKKDSKNSFPIWSWINQFEKSGDTKIDSTYDDVYEFYAKEKTTEFANGMIVYERNNREGIILSIENFPYKSVDDQINFIRKAKQINILDIEYPDDYPRLNRLIWEKESKLQWGQGECIPSYAPFSPSIEIIKESNPNWLREEWKYEFLKLSEDVGDGKGITVENTPQLLNPKNWDGFLMAEFTVESECKIQSVKVLKEHPNTTININNQDIEFIEDDLKMKFKFSCDKSLKPLNKFIKRIHYLSSENNIKPENKVSASIILGSFSIEENARKLEKNLILEGYSPAFTSQTSIINGKLKNNFKVSVIINDTKEKISEIHSNLKVKYKDAWISYDK